MAKKSVKKSKKVAKKTTKNNSKKSIKKLPQQTQKKVSRPLGFKRGTWLFINLLLIAVAIYGMVHAFTVSAFEGASILGLVLIVWLVLKFVAYIIRR